MQYAYQVVAEDLLRRMREGEWNHGEQIPPLRLLEKEYPQSRMTLYKALQNLEDRGHITMSRRRGTFVKAANLRQRVALLTCAEVFRHGCMPFAFQAFRHAQTFFARVGLDSQLYAEDEMSDAGLPIGLLHELEQDRLAGLLAIDAHFPARFMRTDTWKRIAVPVINIGAYRSPHMVYVDREAFFRQATAFAASQGRRRIALVERAEHVKDHYEWFQTACARNGIEPCPYPPNMPSPELNYEEFGYELVNRFFRESQRPDAVLVPDDVIAKGVAQAALGLRLAVPDELTILAMTNSGARFFYPVPIVRFEVDVETIVVRASRMLMDMVRGVVIPPQRILIPPMDPDVDAAPPPATSANTAAETKQRGDPP